MTVVWLIYSCYCVKNVLLGKMFKYFETCAIKQSHRLCVEGNMLAYKNISSLQYYNRKNKSKKEIKCLGYLLSVSRLIH